MIDTFLPFMGIRGNEINSSVNITGPIEVMENGENR